MGQLPAVRTTRSRPFLNSGVDYAGPFELRTWRGRGAKKYKSYLVVFVCFVTSAVHLALYDPGLPCRLQKVYCAPWNPHIHDQ